jgi:RluA family pseudouridine synthase
MLLAVCRQERLGSRLLFCPLREDFMRKGVVEIIYQDDDIVVINKPSGFSVTADRSGKAQLRDLLGEQFGQRIAGELRLVHRLDKDTSGVMILAKNAPIQSTLSGCFGRRQVKKTYLALVTGAVPAQEGAIDAPLAQDRKNSQLMRIARKKGKEAITHWRLLADFGTIALLAVTPETGRTHQIRVHLPSIGLALAIDPIYGSSKPLFLSEFKSDYHLGKGQIEKPLIDRLTLHAYEIDLPQPGTKPPVIPANTKPSVIPAKAGIHPDTQPNRPDCFIARLDKKFAATLKMLTKYNPKGRNAFVNPDDFNTITSSQRLS